MGSTANDAARIAGIEIHCWWAARPLWQRPHTTKIAQVRESWLLRERCHDRMRVGCTTDWIGGRRGRPLLRIITRPEEWRGSGYDRGPCRDPGGVDPIERVRRRLPFPTGNLKI